MKDILISAIRLKKEVITLLICFLIGFVANIGSIIYYKSDATEIFTSLPYVLVFMLAIYFLWSLFRMIKWLIFNFRRK